MSDVRPGSYVSLFSGIGGLDLAVEAFFGYEPAAFVEWDAACQRVLARHWPGVPIFGDISEFGSASLANTQSREGDRRGRGVLEAQAAGQEGRDDAAVSSGQDGGGDYPASADSDPDGRSSGTGRPRYMGTPTSAEGRGRHQPPSALDGHRIDAGSRRSSTLDTHADRATGSQPDLGQAGGIAAPRWGDAERLGLGDNGSRIELVCGGFPCQDLSTAGKRSGFKGDRSSLFYQLARVVAELEPRYVLLENVRGLLTATGAYSDERGAAFSEVTGTLADLGFTRMDWVMLGASDVGAPHRRHRIFLLATHPDRERGLVPHRGQQSAIEVPVGHGEARGAGAVPDPEHDGSPPSADTRTDSRGTVSQPGRLRQPAGAGSRHPADASDADLRRREQRDSRERGVSEFGKTGAPSGNFRHDADPLIGTPTNLGAGGGKRSSDYRKGRQPNPAEFVDEFIAGGFRWGVYEPAIRRWERVIGHLAPMPIDEQKRLSADFVTWMMAFPPGWNEGETRTHRLKQLGNAVVWLQAYRALELLSSRADEEVI